MSRDRDIVWNRAALGHTYEFTTVGDFALASLLRAHGLIMNGGVAHANECLSQKELLDAIVGYEYFGLARAGELLNYRPSFDEDENLLDREYYKSFCDDVIVGAFYARIAEYPQDFAPLTEQDRSRYSP